MLSQEFQDAVKQQVVMSKIIWGAFIMTILVFVFIIYFMHHQSEASTAENIGVLAGILTVVAVLESIGSIWLYSYHSSQHKVKQHLAKEVSAEKLAANPQTRQVDQQRLEKLKALRDFELRLLRLCTQRFPLLLINWALNESVAIFGFVLAFVSQNPNFIIPFAVAAAALDLYMFPRMQQFVEQAARYEGTF